MSQVINETTIKQLFTEARSHKSWTDKAVSTETLKQIYDLMKWAPTSMNLMPARIIFLTTTAAKERLIPALMGSNIEQVKTAPVTAIIAYDEKFYELNSKLFPAYDASAMFAADVQFTKDTAFRNSSLQGGYLIMAARSLGLDVNAMSGFNNKAVDELFFSGTTLKSNFIVTMGYGDAEKLFPRGPRLLFEESCQIL